ncbi:hypothetical protein [Pseudovibrio japonicus]|nr:hypothetical protein [Pseudovibrio japonicus]
MISDADLQNWELFEKACILLKPEERESFLMAEGWQLVPSSAGAELPFMPIGESRRFNLENAKVYRSGSDGGVLITGDFQSADATEASPACSYAVNVQYSSAKFFDENVKKYVFQTYKRDADSYSRSINVSGGVTRTSWLGEAVSASDGKKSIDVAGVSYIPDARGDLEPSLILRVNK